MKTTAQKNRLILEFMDIKPKFNTLTGSYQYSNQPYFSINSKTYEEAMQGTAEYVKYNTSWDWLIPVIECCCHTLVEETKKGEQLYKNIDTCLLRLDLEATYNAVIEYIEFYNTLKK